MYKHRYIGYLNKKMVCCFERIIILNTTFNFFEYRFELKFYWCLKIIFLTISNMLTFTVYLIILSLRSDFVETVQFVTDSKCHQ